MTATSGEDGLPIVDLRFESLRKLQEELGPYLAQEGLFLRGRSDFGPSDVVRFRIMLPGDFVLVEGAGVIVWVRGKADAGPLDPVGAAMGFATLSEQGRELVEQMIQTHIGNGGRPFDFSRPATSTEREEAEGTQPNKSGGLAGLRFNVRGEPRGATDSVVEAGMAVAAAIAGDSEFKSNEDGPSLPFVDEPIEQSAAPEPPADILQAEEERDETPEIESAIPEDETIGAEELSLKEFGESILGPDEEPEELSDEVVTDLDSLLELVESVPDATVEATVEDESIITTTEESEVTAEDASVVTAGDESEVSAEDEPVVTAGVESVVSDEDESQVNATEDAASAFEPVLEAAEEYVAAVSDETPTGGDVPAPIEGAELGPAFGVEPGESGGAFPENAFFATIEDDDALQRPSSRVWLLLAALILVVVVWLGWSYTSGGWPFSSVPATASTSDDSVGEVGEITAGEISDAELEAVVSAAVEAVVQDDREGFGDEIVTTEEGKAGNGQTGEGQTDREPVTSTPASVISEIRWEPRADGTVIILRGNGSMDESQLRVDALSSPPRILIRMRGIVESYRPVATPVGTADVRALRVGHHPELKPPALWVVLDIADVNIEVKGVEVEGNTARVLVGR